MGERVFVLVTPKKGFVVSLGFFSSNSAQWTVWSKGRESIIPLFNESCHP